MKEQKGREAKAHKTDINKKLMLEALEIQMGNVSKAAEATNIARCSHYEWIEADPEYKKAVDGINEGLIDFVESELVKRIKSGDTTGIIFFLKCKGKHRGYSERTELTGANGDPLIPAKQRTVQITVVRQNDESSGG